MKELDNILAQYNSKSYTGMIQRRPVIMKFLMGLYGNDSTIPEMLWCYVNKSEPAKCHCGNKAKFNTFNKGYRKVCSVKCKGSHHSQKMHKFWDENPDVKITMQHKKEKTNIKKYGNKNAALNGAVKAKTKVTNLERYGTEYPLQSLEIQSKIKATVQKNHGVDYPFQSAEIIKKGHATTTDRYGGLMTQARAASYEKYGGINPFASAEVKSKIRNTMKLKYGYEHAKQAHMSKTQIDTLSNKEMFIEVISDLSVSEAALKINVSESTIGRWVSTHECKDVLSISVRSKWEYKMTEFLISLGLTENTDFVRGDRKILGGHELDFYFPTLGVAVEVGSIFWHSENSAGRTRQYHYNKWKGCHDKGITLLQYWDHELENHWAVIESKIRYLTGKIPNKVGARKITSVVEISLDTEREFLNANHLQGQTNGRTISLGAYINDALVGVILFTQRKDYYELVRYATTLDTVYSGLFSKLFKSAVHKLNLQPGTRIVSYSDNRHSNGNVYTVNKFKQINTPRSAYWYTKNYHSIENQQRYKKSKIAKKFDYDMTDKTEWQAMQELGYDRIWDAGKIKWEFTV